MGFLGFTKVWGTPLYLTVSLLFIATLTTCQYTNSPEEIKFHFERDEIIPDVLAYGPTHELKVKYGREKMNFGTAFLASQVEHPPSVTWDADEGAYYTLLMTDLDVPDRKSPRLREYQHWLVVNIPENHLEKGQVLTEYIGVVPRLTKVIHRYVMFVFKQPGNGTMKFKEPYKGKEVPDDNLVRGQFYTNRFSNKYKLGRPIFGNFFVSGPVLDPRNEGDIDEVYRKANITIDHLKE